MFLAPAVIFLVLLTIMAVALLLWPDLVLLGLRELSLRLARSK